MCLLQAMCASSSSKFRTAYKNKRPRRAAATASITVGSWPVSDCVIVSNKRKKIQYLFALIFADQLQEQQQRYCFPVRPVQRVQHQQQPRASAPPAASSTVLRLRQPTTSNAAVGVVTPNTTNGNDELQCIPSSSSTSISNNNFSSNSQSPSALQTLVNRLFGETSHQTTRSQIEVLRTLFGLDENWNNNSGQQSASGLIEVNLIK